MQVVPTLLANIWLTVANTPAYYSTTKYKELIDPSFSLLRNKLACEHFHPSLTFASKALAYPGCNSWGVGG